MKLLICLLTIFTALGLQAGTLRVCYDAYFFLKMGESCISYSINDNILSIESAQHTTGLVDLAHHMEQKVSSEIILRPLASKYLFFYEKSSRKTMTHHYFYEDKIKFSGNTYKYKSGKYKSSTEYFDRSFTMDPTLAVLYMQLYDHKKKNGTIKSFFDGKYIKIEYHKKHDENIEYGGEMFRCRVIDFTVPVKTSSLVTPTGVWRIYIDKPTGIIMGLELMFPLGKARLKPVSIEGDRSLFQRFRAKNL